MASVGLVFSDVLFFEKSGRIPLKILKTALTDFYAVKDIVAANELLIGDIEAIESSSETMAKLQHVPHWRDSEDRLAREVDDIITILNHLDQQQEIEELR